MPGFQIQSRFWDTFCTHKTDICGVSTVHFEKKKACLCSKNVLLFYLNLFNSKANLCCAPSIHDFFRTVGQISRWHSSAAGSLTAGSQFHRLVEHWKQAGIHPGWDAMLCMYYLCLCGFLPASLVSSHIPKTRM